MSGLTNIALLSDISRIEKKTDNVLTTLNRAQLIATLYVLKEKPNKLKKFKEETQMKNIGSKFSNRTKVIGGMTILLGIGTVISAARDFKEIKEIENEAVLLEDVTDGVEQLASSIEEATDAAAEVIEF